ncbi:MAG: Na(+)-translocating NADH-quinone reductase subunit A [Candidatus Marinimicrobia bacterium]|jgi:Na+-transporting NADH:ubiquinone oxidoreductase subunit A|nr:Na(+)-translocating NADH-quinone reductase subunit A [Candidatus Neomarinimicrobiota bacterium]MBT3501852.1 Na(+)-translocating NADH-quinone reductase subunit A [Candidatus Neomarinimicrobiota bacterium]MBT3838622.1 Na(+)-translocating NADH-quinone reductase subunit A [Candidatus Neomarinimicrobiota bacterium]MBT3999764.1 Na(+)-translocating NADH-quinone reductase subunit A [Candidatus Neomarinimicrobiota bacterium]MBT4578633.1 Na(+)-translocating NADH-quinone reductase subunit A [Candidatus
MKKIIIYKGHDIRISGIPTKETSSIPKSETVALLPKTFRGVKPKLLVNEGDTVKIGSPLFFDKTKPDVKWASPANGLVKTIQFGARRSVEKIEISVSGTEAIRGEAFRQEQLTRADRPTILSRILEGNLFTLIRQRPYNKISNPNDTPRDIFISAVNSAPLSVQIETVIESEKEAFQAGVTALSKLTDGKVYVTFRNAIELKDAIVQTISGPHPAGNVGIQIHHTKPITPGDIVWTVNPQHVITLGKLFLSGVYVPDVIVTVAGPGATAPQTVYAKVGSRVDSLIINQKLTDPTRLISGDVLTGQLVADDGFLGFYDSAVTLIPDTVERPFMGMLSIGSSDTKYSLTNTFVSLGEKLFKFTSSQNGEERAIIPLNAWDNVLPMDILPNELYRSILAQDIEEMEQLGMWECDDEDFALCSFACPSKIDVGAVIRSGLDLFEQEC